MSIFKKNKSKTADTWEARYGMVPLRDAAVDEALGDPVLTEAVGALRRGNWKPVAAALAGTGVDWDRRMLHAGVLGAVAAENTAWLDAWVAAEPESPHAALLQAATLGVLAAKARGGAWAQLTPVEQLRAYARITEESDQAALRTIALAPDDPTPWAFRIQAARGRQLTHRQFTELWHEAFMRAPMHRRAHSHAHQYWLAKWFGSEELSANFVAEAVARAPQTPLALELSVHRALEAWLVHRSTSKMPGTSRAYFQGVGQKYIDAAIEQWDGRLPTGGSLETVDRNLLAWTLTMARRYDEACDVFEVIGGKVCFGYPWIYFNSPVEGFGTVRRWAIEGSLRKPTK